MHASRFVTSALLVAMAGAGGWALAHWSAAIQPPPLSAPAESATDTSAATIAHAPAPSAPSPSTPAVSSPSAPALPRYATVTRVTPVERSEWVPEQVCEWVAPAPRDPNRITGSVLGAAVGGVVGHQFGGGRGKDVATVAGAIAGGMAGRALQQQRQANQSAVQQCHTTQREQKVVDHYLVQWEWAGRRGSLTMDRDPGAQLPVRHGEVVAG